MTFELQWWLDDWIEERLIALRNAKHPHAEETDWRDVTSSWPRCVDGVIDYAVCVTYYERAGCSCCSGDTTEYILPLYVIMKTPEEIAAMDLSEYVV